MEQRATLVTSQPAEGAPSEALTSKLKEIDNYIVGYKQGYFIGSSDKSTWVGNFEFAPPNTAPYLLGLLSYSEMNGILRNKRRQELPGAFILRQNL